MSLIDFESNNKYSASIKVIGVGGGGTNAVNAVNEINEVKLNTQIKVKKKVDNNDIPTNTLKLIEQAEKSLENTPNLLAVLRKGRCCRCRCTRVC